MYPLTKSQPYTVKGPFVWDVKISAQDDLKGQYVCLFFDERSTQIQLVDGEEGGMFVDVGLKEG